jgi:hypothetical protein
MKTLNIYGFIIILTLLVSCNESPVDYNAELMTLEEIQKMPGFGWYYSDYAIYTAKQQDINDLLNPQNFNPDTDQFLVFVQPSCTCEGDHRGFPKVAKTIIEAGLGDKMILYVIPNKESRHPYMDKIDIPQIPYYHILRNGEPAYEMIFTNGNTNQFKFLNLQ